MSSSPLPPLLIKPLVQAALIEDLGRRGDITTAAVIDPGQVATLNIVARQSGILCGMDLAVQSFVLMDPALCIKSYLKDGDALHAGSLIASVSGSAHAILAAERTALNFLTHLSGIATMTHQIQTSIASTHARVTCTRKTLPGLRILQKYAVRIGGGKNHRMGLDDAILIKDNHIALSGGLIRQVIRRAKNEAGHLMAIEVEVDTLAQLEQALAEGISLVLLDNMSLDDLHTAVSLCRNRCQAEASGGITPESALSVAQTGVDFLAMGYLTHSARYLDIGLDVLPDSTANE